MPLPLESDEIAPGIPRGAARAHRLVVLLDLDVVADDDASEHELAMTLRALISTRVHVVLVSARGRDELLPMRGRFPGALWAPDHGRWRNDYDRWQHVEASPGDARAGLAGWVAELLPEPTVLAFTDGTLDPVVVRSALARLAETRQGAERGAHSPAASHERPVRSVT